MLDSYARRINYLRISVTDRCNLRCKYCMPEEGVEFIPHERIISFEKIRDIAAVAASMGFDKLRLTGGEPLVRKGIIKLVAMLAGISGIRILAMTTNGTLLAPMAGELRKAGLSSVNISLDTMDPLLFSELTRGGNINDAIAGIIAARREGFPVKLNTVVSDSMPKGNLEEVGRFAREHGCLVQTIREYRLDSQKTDDSHFMRPPPCSDCNRIRLLATGELKPCLHNSLAVQVDYGDIAGSIRKCIELKPSCGASLENHAVNSIGG